MRSRERAQTLLPDGGEYDANDPLVVPVLQPSDKSGQRCSVDEFYRAVVFEQEMCGELAHTRRRTVASDGEEELVLGRSHAGGVCSFLAPVQEPAQTVPESEQPLIVGVGQLLWVCPRSLHILTR